MDEEKKKGFMIKMFNKIFCCISILVFLSGCRSGINAPAEANKINGKWSSIFTYSRFVVIWQPAKTQNQEVDTLRSMLVFNDTSYSLQVTKLDGTIMDNYQGGYKISGDSLSFSNSESDYGFILQKDSLKIQYLAPPPSDTVSLRVVDPLFDSAVMNNFAREGN